MNILATVKKYKDELNELYYSGWDPLTLIGHYGTAMKVFEAQTLYSIIKENEYRDILEIGTAQGFSALYLCKALESLQQPVSFDSVDIGPESESLATGLLSKQGVDTSFTNFICEDSKVAIPSSDKQYDMCLIDGAHDYLGTKSDLINVFPKIRKGGCIVMDDIQPTLSTDTPYWVWQEVIDGDIIEDNIETYELDAELFNFFSYPYDINECARLQQKWMTKSWIANDVDPRKTVGVIFKK